MPKDYEYWTSWLSLYPLENYRVIILGNQNYKYLDIWSSRNKEIVI